MAKVDLMLISGLIASDGSIVASGATLKFDSEFKASTTRIRIFPRLYRNRELFESGYTSIHIADNIIPDVFEITLPEEEYYVLTPLLLYEAVGDWLNNFMGGTYFELQIIV